ncbi:MAG: HAD family hydrolase [Rhizobiaceae bacterium]|nr:HAD family hydrolase [Rhizobiaceae bacterium]
MPLVELVIFDCDGVLVDSEIIAARVETAMLAKVGIEIDPVEFAGRYAGLTFRDILMRLEAETGQVLQASMLDNQKAELDRRLAREVRAISGVAQAVTAVKQPRCICSNSRSERLEMMLNKTGLMPLFEGRVFSAMDLPDKRPKPAPDVYLHAASVMNTAPAKCMVLEDSVHGVAAAKAAGMRVIGFTGGSHSYPGHSDVLTEAGAETAINRWADLGPVLDALSVWSDNETLI